jgi:hypothetical protein
VRNKVTYDKLKKFGKIITNSYGLIISRGGSFFFLENWDTSCLHPQVTKSILGQAKTKENRYKNFNTLYTAESDFDGHSHFTAF